MPIVSEKLPTRNPFIAASYLKRGRQKGTDKDCENNVHANGSNQGAGHEADIDPDIGTVCVDRPSQFVVPNGFHQGFKGSSS